MITIELPCKMSDDLHWTEQKQKALEAVKRGKKIFWAFDLPLDAPYFPLEDEFTFNGLALALSTFTKELWPLFQEHTEGASLYQGSPDFSPYFLWSEKQQSQWSHRSKDKPKTNETHLRSLFCADAFAFYFRMLSHRLPDELPISLIFDLKETGFSAEILQLVSKERFEFFHVELTGAPLSEYGSLALCFPEEEMCSLPVLEKLNQMLDRLEKPLRVIYEPFLTEQWEGVESLYVLSEAVSEKGKRKLKGFCASGGKVLTE